MPIQANAESVCVTPTPEVSRRNGPTNATTYVTTTSRVLERSASPPCHLRASSPLRRTTSRRSHAPSRRPESQFVTRTHIARSGLILRAPIGSYALREDRECPRDEHDADRDLDDAEDLHSSQRDPTRWPRWIDPHPALKGCTHERSRVGGA